jgi:hypothetical protein
MAAALTETRDKLSSAMSAEETAAGSGPVLILGAPRSGTSWLGKIFDSHPFVIYRHEPDDVVGQADFPGICPVEDIPRFSDAARRYVEQLTRVRQIKSSGTWPVFAKPFQPFPAPFIRRALAIAIRGGQEIMPNAGWLKRMSIPDLIVGDRAQITYVIKSVSMLGDAALLASALPEARIIAVFRHPCGHIASIKRGPLGGLYGPRVLATARARELGLTRERYEQLPELERWVCGWALLHAKLFDEARDRANVHLLRYEDLCQQPTERARALMAFAGLPWAEENARFIEKSTSSGDSQRYYSLFRDPINAATKWRRELSPEEIARVMAMVDQVLPGYFTD